MSEGIFSRYAPLAWERDLRVLPIEPGDKRPAKEISGWPGYLAAIPGAEIKTAWLSRYASNGWGVLLGSKIAPDHQLVALDIDDDRLVKPTLAVLGINPEDPSYCAKRGMKGLTVFMRAPKKGFKSTVIEGAEPLGNIDVLGAGKETVMPPSIHPDTGKPYENLGTTLLEADLALLPELTKKQVKLLKVVFGSPHVPTLMRGELTHIAGLEFAAQLVSAGASDQEAEALVRALLPVDYKGDSLKELPEWLSSARDKGYDQREGRGPSLAQAVMEVAVAGCVELFNDGDRNGYASVAAESGVVTYRVNSEGFKTWVRYQAHKALDRPVGAGPLLEAIAGIEAMALFDGASYVVNNRVAGDDEIVEIDLGTSDGRTVVIVGGGWRVSQEPRSKFARGSGYSALPEPVGGGKLSDLQELLGLSMENFLLVIAFIINALKPGGPFFILLVEGEQGSGKSFICEIIKRILDPNKAGRLRLPDNERDLMIQAKEYRHLNFDNASGMKAEMSDALCALATGGGIAVRKLYTDGDLHVMSFARPFVLNGISGYVNRPDLMERAIPLKLPALPENTRKTEAELLAAFEAILPGLLGVLYDAVSAALRNLASVEPPRHLRMADAARWIKAAEPALSLEGELIGSITEAQNEFVLERINDDPLVMKLRGLAVRRALEGKEGPFVGYVADLFTAFGEASKGLPPTPSRLSHTLKRLRPAMEKAGVTVEFLPRDRAGQKVRVTVDRSRLEPTFEQD
ncbi:bifunctional DNA primase/polymerase [Hansschlegelia plantiphila]|uniref:DNA primase/polymerase bifunctional N-terminal domain-containing protein n=1 Tax=Hansschlegelia plantiphila TaxID=374655 RepID=A0A9W6J4S5_9HYPH|nr:bifunctional DNA primase/polymerase [Hansschlegelia plantiphila]GLK69786.1 hypothetical protein GCM10008179_34240 [Hansschlegelia plantiphila]